MARFKKKAQTWHLKRALGLGAVFAGCLVAYGGARRRLVARPDIDRLHRHTCVRSQLRSRRHVLPSQDRNGLRSRHRDLLPHFRLPRPVHRHVRAGHLLLRPGFRDRGRGRNRSSARSRRSRCTRSTCPPAPEQAVISALRANPNVANVERNDNRKTEGTPSDPGYVGPVEPAAWSAGIRSTARPTRSARRRSPCSTPASPDRPAT